MSKFVPSYVNKKGKEVELKVSRHAVGRFIERWRFAFPGEALKNSQVIPKMTEIFSHTNRVKNFSGKEKRRMARHGQKDVLYFRTQSFTFVVSNGHIITVELSGKDLRQFN